MESDRSNSRSNSRDIGEKVISSIGTIGPINIRSSPFISSFLGQEVNNIIALFYGILTTKLD